MTYILIGVAAVVIVCVVVAVVVMRARRPKKRNNAYFAERWQEIQGLCKSRKTWPDAIVQADNLLCEALRRSKFKGKTTGERLVAAQRKLTSNDTVWAGHKLRNSIVGQDVRKLKKQDVVKALTGFRQALRDLGALDA